MMKAVYDCIANHVAACPQQLGCHESLLAMIYNCYKDQHNMETAEVKSGFEMIYSLLNDKSSDETEEFIDAVCALCSEHEKVAFIEGIQLGVRLAQEVSFQTAGFCDAMYQGEDAQ